MEHTSEVVAEGKLLHETSYPQRAEKYTEIEIGGSKIDFYDVKEQVIHEVKKSDKMEEAHLWQVKYYIWLMEQHGIAGVRGIIEYPKLKETKQVALEAEDRQYLEQCIKDIQRIVESNLCPSKTDKRICKNCSYFDFCWIDE